jgi:hypothetical protein
MPFTNRGAFSACEWPDRARPEELTYNPVLLELDPSLVYSAGRFGTCTWTEQIKRGSYMPRIQTLFASAAVGVLLLGLLTSRLKLGSELVVTFRQTGYGLPYSMLCYVVALFFCLFAVLYSVWMVPWSVRAANWHFGLSVLLVGVFCAASFAADRFKLLEGSSSLAMTVLVAFSFSPVLFLLIQGAFILDGLRRVWPFLRAWG